VTTAPFNSKLSSKRLSTPWLWGMLVFSALVSAWAFTMPWVLEYLKDPVHRPYLDRSFILLLFHVLAAGTALLIGPIQFILGRGFNRYPVLKSWHSNLGKLYFCAVVIGTIGGTYLSFYVHGGMIGGVGLLILNVLWISSTTIAVGYIVKGDVAAHKKWMIRSFAFTFAAVTLRVMQPPLSLFFDGETVSRIVYWACWIVNLAVVELWMRFKK
jgi:uncharacterized membrane protein